MTHILVSELMIPNPTTIAHNQTVEKAMELMARYDIRRLPVVKDSKLVGIISDRDLRQMGSRYSLKLPKTDQDDAHLQLPVEEAMTLSVITIREHNTLEDAIKSLIKNKISGLPVVNAEGALVGMLSHQDVLKYCLGILEREADRDRSI